MIGTLVHYYKKVPGNPFDGPHAGIITSQTDDKYVIVIFSNKMLMRYVENVVYWNESDSADAPPDSWRYVPKNVINVNTELPDRFELLGWRVPTDDPPKENIDKPAGLWVHATCNSELDMIVSDLRADRETEVFAADGTPVVIPQGWHMAFVPPNWKRKE